MKNESNVKTKENTISLGFDISTKIGIVGVLDLVIGEVGIKFKTN